MTTEPLYAWYDDRGQLSEPAPYHDAPCRRDNFPEDWTLREVCSGMDVPVDECAHCHPELADDDEPEPVWVRHCADCGELTGADCLLCRQCAEPQAGAVGEFAGEPF